MRYKHRQDQHQLHSALPELQMPQYRQHENDIHQLPAAADSARNATLDELQSSGQQTCTKNNANRAPLSRGLSLALSVSALRQQGTLLSPTHARRSSDRPGVQKGGSTEKSATIAAMCSSIAAACAAWEQRRQLTVQQWCPEPSSKGTE